MLAFASLIGGFFLLVLLTKIRVRNGRMLIIAVTIAQVSLVLFYLYTMQIPEP